MQQIKMYPQVLAILQAAAVLHPRSAEVQYRLGCYYQGPGDKTRALESYKKALAIDPKLDSAKKPRRIWPI